MSRTAVSFSSKKQWRDRQQVVLPDNITPLLHESLHGPKLLKPLSESLLLKEEESCNRATD